MQYYTTYPINEQGRNAHDLYYRRKAELGEDAKFDWDYHLKPVTVVAILNFQFRHNEGWQADKLRSSYRLREDGCGEIMTDALRFVFLELGRFNKYIWELESVFDKWMYLLKHVHEMVEIPQEFADPLFKRLFLLAEIDKFTAAEKKQYLKSLENMGDYRNMINSAAEEAEKRGHAAGLAAGIMEAARRMLAAGMSLKSVSEILQVPESELQKQL